MRSLGGLVIPVVSALPGSPVAGQVVSFAGVLYQYSGSNWAPLFDTLITTTTADFTGTNVATAQPIFAPTEDALTVAAATTYVMEGCFHIHTTGTVSHTLGLLFGGTATLTDIGYTAQATNTATEALGAPSALWCAAATIQVVSAAVATASHHNIQVKGLVRIATAGTFIPQYQWSAAPGVAGVTLKDGYFMLRPMGTNVVKAVGPWA